MRNEKIGLIGTNAIVAGGVPLATGAAFAAKYTKSSDVVVCFLGDGAVNQGAFHDAVKSAVDYCTNTVNEKYVVKDELWPKPETIEIGRISNGSEFKSISFVEKEEFSEFESISFVDAIATATGRWLQKDDRVFVIVEQAPKNLSIGSKIAEHCQAAFFDYLDGPITTISGLDIPNPVSKKLESAAVPSLESIQETILRAARRKL
jgi:deoxyxylulose-5-phosphate synthase